MCGIAGMYLREGLVDEARLAAMASRLAHRGPDEAGSHVDGALGLAHTRLSIIDLSTGHQPLFTEDRSLCLVANGEIYNHLELRRELENRGHSFATHSDCEPLLYAYREWGTGFLDHVHGMFAFALYDRLQQRLLLARDRLGIKPLFLCRRRDGLYFASEIKALLPVLGAMEVNPAGLAQFLESNFTCGETTAVAGVTRLSPGLLLAVAPGGTEQSLRYWSARNVEPAELTLGEAKERFDGLMGQVIREHMRTDVPFGLFLSGGVDSSILAGLLSGHSNEPLRTFSVGFPAAGVANELPAAARVAQRFATRHCELSLARGVLLERLPHCLWAADELMGDYANLPTSLLAQRAGAELKVVFSGEGGDEVFAGYGRYRVPRVRRWLSRLGGRDAGFRTRGMFDRCPSSHALFTPELLEGLARWREPFADSWRSAPRHWSDLQRMQYVDMITWLPDDLLVKADRMLMAWGVEGRVPYLDHRVVEFGLSLPDHLKVSGRNGKVLLKRWGERFLSGEELWGRKRGFTVPVREWLRGALLDRLERVLPEHAALRPWFRPAGLRRLIASQRRTGHYSQPLWAIFQFVVWHALFIAGNGSEPAPSQDPLDLIG